MKAHHLIPNAVTSVNDELESYRRAGFLIVRGAVQGDQLIRLERELDRLREDVETGTWRGNHLMENQRKARVIFGPYDHCPALRELVGRADMVARAQAILGPRIHLHHTKLMCKPAQEGTPQPWHQDYYYWPGKKANQVAVFICVDPSTEENGCLRCIPGTHIGGLREHREQLHEVTGERHWVSPVSPEELSRQVLFLGEPGDLIFFSSMVIHGSEGNRSAIPRRAVIFEYDELGNLPPSIGWGAPMPKVEWT